jgi:hypothetical protein
MSLLNSKYSNFNVTIPPTFFPEVITAKYEKFINRLPIPFDNIKDYINWSIQSISWPEISTENAVQAGTKFGDRSFKGSKDTQISTDKVFDITFKTNEGFLNYFIMLEVLQDYWALDQKEVYKPDINLSLLDYNGYMFVTYTFKQLVFKGISALELSYASNVPEYKTFNCSFSYNYSEIRTIQD